jgi:hypothetical protein
VLKYETSSGDNLFNTAVLPPSELTPIENTTIASIYTCKSFCEGVLTVGFAVVEPGVWGELLGFVGVVFDVDVLGADPPVPAPAAVPVVTVFPEASTLFPDESVVPVLGDPVLGGPVGGVEPAGGVPAVAPAGRVAPAGGEPAVPSKNSYDFSCSFRKTIAQAIKSATPIKK